MKQIINNLHLCLGVISKDAGFAAAGFCQTNPSPLHQKHPVNLHPYWHLWLLGGSSSHWEHWLDLIDSNTVTHQESLWHQMLSSLNTL